MNQNPITGLLLVAMLFSIIYPPLALPLHILNVTLTMTSPWPPLLQALPIIAVLGAMAGLLFMLFAIGRTFAYSAIALYMAGSYFHFMQTTWHAGTTSCALVAGMTFLLTLWISAKAA